jgi:hypothetical protein
LRLVGFVALAVALVPLTLWAAAALFFDFPVPWLRGPLVLLYLLLVLTVWIVAKRRWFAAGITLGGFALVVAWWFTLQPSNERDWQPDLARLSSGEIDGNRVTLHNIRHCDYRTETDFDVRYYDRTIELDRLRTADLFLIYWGSPHMAHTMISFGFEEGDYLCFSIEARKEKGEGYSAIKGFFRQFELIYIVADERDLVRLRTNYRKGEETYLYRSRMTPDQVRTFFLGYVRRLNQLRDRPEWYNALTENCSTAIRTQRAAHDRAPWNWRMLANGHLDELLYERGTITTNLSFAELKQRSHINGRAQAAGPEANFSQLIRQGLP